MTEKEKLFVESELFNAIRTFHDCDEKERRETYVRNYFFNFCKKWQIDPDEALSMVKKLLDKERTSTPFDFRYYKDIDSIIFPGRVNDTDRDDR